MKGYITLPLIDHLSQCGYHRFYIMHRILYVDDEPDLLEITKLFLEDTTDFSVDTNTSAQHALHSISAQQYDAIISDYQMPGMDGIAFLKSVRSRYRDIPFILFTGRGREDIVIEAINNGADFYLQKGGDPTAQFAELAHKIRQAIARRQAEFSRIESEKRLTDIINFLPDATFAIDRSGKVISWNRALEEMTGVAAADILGRGEYEYAIPFYGIRRKILIDLIFEPDDIIASHYAHIFHDKGILIADTTLPRPMGRIVTLMGKASPLYNRQGEIVGAIESIRDMTELKKAEESLRESEGRFSAFMDHLPVTAFIKDEQSTNLFVNRHMEEIFGAREWIGKSVHDQFPKEAADKMIEDDRQTIRDGYRKTLENLYTKKGDLKVFETYKFRIDRENNPPLIGGFAIDITEQKEAERALNESEEKYRLVVENSHDPIYIYRDTRLLFVNTRASDLTGYTKGELLNMNLWDLIHPDDRTRLQESATRRLAGEEVAPVFTARILTKTGDVREGNFFVDRIIYRGQSAILGIFRDMAEQKRAENSLQKSEEKYRLALDATNDSIWDWNISTGTTFFSPRWYTMLGYEPGELPATYATWRSLVHPEDLVPVEQKIEDHLGRKQESYSIEYRMRTKQGDWKWIHARGKVVKRDTEGNPLLMVGTHTDIDERKRIEEALRESEEDLRTIIEQSPLSIQVLSPDGWTLKINHAFEELWGVTLEDLKDYNMLEDEQLTLLGTMPCIKQGFSGEAAAIPPVQYDTNKVLSKVPGFGGKRWVQGRIYPVRDTAGIIRNVILVHEDITDLMRVENALRQANKKLTLLTSVTRHDIDNQITTLLGFLRILEKKQPDPTLSEYFQKISTTAKRVSAMIRFTKEYERIGIHEPVWQDTRMIIRTAAKESPLGKVIVKNDLPSGTEVFADPLIVKVFYNLMDNAVRYGNKITTIRFTLQESGDDHVISCEDDGEGIPAEEKERIFSRGYGKNTGMGLFLAREILSITGITIRETGEPGKGARFEISVPKGVFRITDIQQKIITE